MPRTAAAPLAPTPAPATPAAVLARFPFGRTRYAAVLCRCRTCKRVERVDAWIVVVDRATRMGPRPEQVAHLAIVGGFAQDVGTLGAACPCGARAADHYNGRPARSVDRIRGTVSEVHKCAAKCTHAIGPICDCSCGGANHGRGHGAGAA